MIRLSLEEKKEIGYQYVLDRLDPASPYGIKRLRTEGFYTPGNRNELDRELDNVGILKKALETDRTAVLDFRQKLAGLKDLSGTFSRCQNGYVLTEVELFELRSFCTRINEMLPIAQHLLEYGPLNDILFSDMEKPLKILKPDRSGSIGFYIEDSRTPELLKARTEKREIERQLRMLRDQPEEENETLLKKRQDAAAAEEKALEMIYSDLSAAVSSFMPLFQKNAEAAGRLDAALAKAILAEHFGCVRPQIGGNELVLWDAVHPQAAAALEAGNRSFSPVSIRMPKGVTVLTGANMGGKSVALRTVLLNTALALSGFFVFCSEAKVPAFTSIELISRDLSDIEIGLSSFGAEILRFNEAAERIPADGLSLIVMDEFARGTNAGEGAAIVRASVKYLSDQNAVTLLATHYDGAAEFAAKHYQVKGLKNKGRIGPDESETVQLPKGGTGYSAENVFYKISNAMDYGLIEVSRGTECPCDAVSICRMLGMPKQILDDLD